MATIGQALTAPEAGWKRIDDTDTKIVYTGVWTVNTSATSSYNSSRHYSATIGNKISFLFKGTKLRIISAISSSYTSSASISIDGINETFSQYNESVVYQALVYEKIGLSDTFHKVEITVTDTTTDFDAVDIDDVGYLTSSSGNIQSNLDSMSIGDFIPCRYTAPASGQVGTFSELGITTVPAIPVASSATPDGSFNFIYVGDNEYGKVLVGDRNIQHSVSWDVLNSKGIASGSGVKLLSNITPIMTSDIDKGFELSSPTIIIGREAYKVFDGKNGNNLTDHTLMDKDIANGNVAILQMKLPNAYALCSYSITSIGYQSSAYMNRTPKKWLFQGSNNGVNWTTVHKVANEDFTTYAETRSYYFENIVEFQYYRLYIEDTKGVSDSVCIGEMQIFIKFDTIRLLTGGISSTDTDNEWHKYIVNSDLNGTITAGDNNIWNWSGAATVTSTTADSGSTYRRGYGIPTAINTNTPLTSTSESSYSFRPVLVVESIPPSKPTGLIATDISYGSATLTWDASENATSYNIYNAFGSKLANIETNSYQVTGLTWESPQIYSITALNNDAESLETFVTFFTLEVPIPNVVENLQVTNITTNSATITWNVNDRANGYKIYDKDDNIVANLTGMDSNSYELSNLTENTAYAFKVNVVNNTGQSEKEVVVFATEKEPYVNLNPVIMEGLPKVVSTYEKMRRCNLSDSGQVNAYYGDSSYKDDGTNGQVMVEIPKFWYKKVGTGTGHSFSISDEPRDGYIVHPAFYRDRDGDGVAEEVDYRYFSAYEGYSDGYKLWSKSGVIITNNITIGTFRTLAQARGIGWGITDFYLLSAVQLLYLIEYEHFDSQTKIGRGYTTTATLIATGTTSTLGNTTGNQSNIGTDGKHTMSYRGIENLYGHMQKFIDGIVTSTNEFKIGNVNFNDLGNGYTSYIKTFSDSQGYLGDIWDEAELGFIGKTFNGTNTSKFFDYAYTKKNKICFFGGKREDDLAAGIFSLSLNYDSTYYSTTITARLAF